MSNSNNNDNQGGFRGFSGSYGTTPTPTIPTPGAGGFGGGGGFGSPGTAAPTPTSSSAMPTQGRPLAPGGHQGRRLSWPEMGSASTLRLDYHPGNRRFELSTGTLSTPLQASDGATPVLDGVCPFDPTAPNPDQRLVLWRDQPGGMWRTEGAPALQVTIHDPHPQAPYEVLTTSGVYAHIPQERCTSKEIESLFFEKIIVLYGDDGLPVYPDLPVLAAWRPCVRSCVRRQDGDGFCYTVQIHGLDGAIERRYGKDEILVAGDMPHVPNPRHLRLMVWPKEAPYGWKLFVTEVGAANNSYAWVGRFSWILLHYPPILGGTDNKTPVGTQTKRLVPCTQVVTSALQQPQAMPPLAAGTFMDEMPARVATRERPHVIEIQALESGTPCGGTFEFPDLKTSVPHTNNIQVWGVDIGTSNSCITYEQNAGPNGMAQHLPVNFNQIFDGGSEVASQVHCRIGHTSMARSDLHWMPGLEGTAIHEPPSRDDITQIPSRVCFLLRDKLYPQLSVTDIEALVPMCNVVVPPLLSYRTFGNEEVNQRTFDRLKWIDSKDAKALALLRKYITTLLIMAAARLRPSGVNAKFSAPLSFGDNQREAFSKVISQAAAEAQALTGVSFQASLTNDESRCIVIKFLESFDHRSSVPLWVVCDIGGGSVDFAVATGGAQGQGPFTSTYALLAADSIRFGADLVFRSFVKSAGREISSGTHEATIEQDVREELAKHGFDSLVERCSPRTKDHIFSVVSCYYYLIGEYLARTVAGCIRNKKRFVGLFEDKNGYGIGALEADELGVQLEVLVTGNGFRTFDVIKEGRSSQRLVEDFSGWVRDRVHALLHTRLSQWENDDVAWFDGMPQPTFKGYYGLSARGHTYLKEALAYSIVATKDLTNTTLSALDVSTPNGLNEFRRGNRMLGLKGAVRPWYAFVGSPKVVRPNLPSDQQGYVMPQDEPWFFNSADIAHDPDTFGPDFPQEVRTFATKLGWNLTLTHLFSQSAVDIRQRISHRDGIQRVNSLLKALYEIGVSRVFTQDWI